MAESGGIRPGRVAKNRRTTTWLILLLAFLFIAVGAIAVGYYSTQINQARKNKEAELSAIADAKVNQIVAWRKERLGDAKNIYETPMFFQSVKSYLEAPTSLLKEQNITWMENVRSIYSYHTYFLLDPDGKIILQDQNHTESLGDQAILFTQQAAQNNQLYFSDLYREENSYDIHMDLFIPIGDIKNKSIKPIAVFLLRIDPNEYLYPLIQTWPILSKTGETVLFRREGNEVVYLNELRFAKDSALRLRFPIDNPNLPSAKAIRGEIGVIEGIDYRGVPVLAATRKIPDSSWYLIAKEDTSEIFSVNRQQGWILAVVIFLVLVTYLLLAYALIRRQRQFYEKEILEAEVERQKLRQSYNLLFEMGNDVILVFDENGSITDVNDRAVESYGYSHAELLQMNAKLLQAAERQDRFFENLKNIKERNGLRFEIVQQKKDGTQFPVEVSIRYFQVKEKGYYINFIHNISERKKAEIALKENLNALQSIINTSPLAVITTDRDGKVTLWSKAAEKIFGWKSEEVLEKPLPYFEENSSDNFESVLNKVLFATGPIQYAGIRKRKDGTVIKVNATSAPIKDYRDEVKGILEMLGDVTELKKIEAENERMTEERFQLLERLRLQFNRMPIGFILTDEKLNILDWNPQAEKIFGFTREETLGKNQYDLIIPKENREFVEEIVKKSTLGNHTEVITHENITKDGRHIMVEWHNTSLWDESGKMIALMAMAIDVTEKIEAERQLRASEEKLRAFFDSNLIGIQFSDIYGNIYSANNEMLRIIGYTRADLGAGQMRWDQLTPPEYADLDKFATEQALKWGSCVPFEKQYIRKDGSLIWVLIGFVIIGKEKENSIAFVLDITERKEAEQEIHSKQELLNLTGQIGKVGGWEFNVETGAGTWTDEVARIHDLDPAAPTSRAIGLNFYTPESRKIIEKATQEAVEQGKSYDLELEIITAKGAYKLVRTIGQPEYVDGKVVQLRGIFQDITELKQAESEVKKLNEELEQRVKERTAELTIANQELESFSYSVSHDLRAPIRAIDGFSQIIVDEYRASLTPDMLRYLQNIRSNTRNMGQLVDDLLAFSRLGRQSIQRYDIKMEELVKGVVDEIKLGIQGREVEFRIGKLPDCRADKNLLRQVYFNLISNAVKFTRIRTHGLIEIGAYKKVPQLPEASVAEKQACYFVRDNGVGFDMRFYDKIFSVFQRLHKPEEYEGTGVGLAIVKRVIEKHGGVVWAESEVNSGATFYFTIGEENNNDQSN